MNWFNQNRWLGTFLVIVGIAVVAGGYFLFSARSNSNEALAKFQETISEKNRLERLDPFPSEANFRKMKQHLEDYSTTLNKLKEELKTRVPPPPPLAPNEFQSKLRQSMLAVSEKAKANRVTLPENFALGFDEYTSGLPSTGAAPLLGQELAQIESLLNMIIDARVDGIAAVARTRLPEEGGATATPTPSPPPRAGTAGSQAAGAGSQLVQRGVIDVTFTAAPSSARKVLNQVVSSPQHLYVVRALHVRNEKDKGPPREQAAHGGLGTPPPVQPTPAKPAPTGAINFIVGNEHIEMSARIELVRFNLQ